MGVVGEGVPAAGGGSGGFIHGVVELGSSSSPLFLWLLTVALVAAIHIASGFISSSPSSKSRSEDEDTEKKSRYGAFAGDEAADGKDDRILEIMRSFSFVHANEEGFVEGMATYDRVVDGRVHELAAPPEPTAASSSLSFSFQYQLPETQRREAAVVLGEIPVEEKGEHVQKEPSIPSRMVDKDEHEDKTDEVVEEEEKQSREVGEAAPKIVSAMHNYRFLTERDFRGFVEEPEAMTVRVQESFVPLLAQPEERMVVDAGSRRGGFATADEFRPANKKPRARDRVASARKRTPLQKRNQATASLDESKGSAVSGRTSFASEFSCFGDSDSESSASDGYSVKELTVDSDSDWFLSEQDFPAAVHDAASLLGYKAKLLKAVESLEEADTLECSFQDSTTTVSPGSVGQASPDSIRIGSGKYPEDMWSRSPSPGAEYKVDDQKGTGLAEEADERNMKDECSFDISDDDDQLSFGSRKMTVAPVYSAHSAAENFLEVEHSEKETISMYDHTKEAISDSEVMPDEEWTVSSYQAAVHDTKRSPETLEREFFGTNDDHSPEVISALREESASTNDQSAASVSDNKRSLDYSGREFVGTDGQSHELISDVWKKIVGAEKEAGEVDYDDKKTFEHSDRELAGTNDHSNELISDDMKAIVCKKDKSYAVDSEDNNTPEHSEQEFSTNDHSYGAVVPAGKNISEPTSDEHTSADAPGRVHFSVTEKAKALGGEGNDQQGKWEDLTEEEEDELESLWEHQNLIEQLKLELKKVRSAGLPTIMEESESPKEPMEDLKPWRIDAKFLHEDPMDELNKFYKSYRERMRKFDILCYQKMYAIDFLHLRGPQQSTNSLKTLSPTVTSILSHNFRSSRRRYHEGTSERFLKELRYDLETVYVGQMCLSWEFLRWQYEQARDLSESDPYHSHHYNRVAGEFQQFQVVVQRFVEDESFKGPRLPNYINSRCVLRNLLQVPVVKEDSPNDRMEDQRKGNYVITSEDLEEVMEEAMRILWEFIKTDRAETGTPVLKGFSSTHVELQDPMDHDLMMRIHATLQKKEKRLKDLLRTGNCIVKKFKKPKENRSNQNLFFSQVDMRLVARVLRMPRITSDQLQWCKAMLDKIMLLDNRKIHREASFFMFPC